MNSDELEKIIDKTVFDTIETISPFVDDWFDSTGKKMESDIVGMKATLLEYFTGLLQQNKCGSCKHWVNDNGDFDGQNKGWGYCTNLRVRTPLNQTEYFSNNELNIQRDSIVTSDFKGMLNELYRAKCIHGIFQTGENFGCIHFAQKDEKP